jgi:hypothetical protein
MSCGAPMLPSTLTPRPMPRMPSMGYEPNSVETFVASPNVRAGESGPMCIVSDASVPETEPVPYATLKGVSCVYNT